jgi:hypothetical protein
MEARLTRVVMLLAMTTASAFADGRYSQNFVVIAPNAEFAQQVCRAAEQYRKTLAIAWLGQELPPWQDRCPITVRVAPNLGAGGVTSFMFEHGRPFGWRMSIQGSAERILDSVLPHEVTHTIFATHFGGPLPRWADEGACTTVEHESEKAKHNQHLYRYLTATPNRGIPFNQMFRMTEYPDDIMPLYAQGHSVVEYLVSQGGRRRFVDFLADGMRNHDWDRSIQEWYGFGDLSDLQIHWVDWLRNGRPALQPNVQLAAASRGKSQPVNVAPSAIVTPVVSGDTGSGQISLASAPADPAPGSTMMAQGSWYARQRDQAQISLARSTDAPTRFTPGSTVMHHAPAASRSTSHAVDEGNLSTSVVDWGGEGYWTSSTPRR